MFVCDGRGHERPGGEVLGQCGAFVVILDRVDEVLVGLDDHPAAKRPRLGVGFADLGAALEVGGHRRAVVAVERLDDHGEAEPFGLLHRLDLVVDDRLPADREPELLEDALGEPLV